MKPISMIIKSVVISTLLLSTSGAYALTPNLSFSSEIKQSTNFTDIRNRVFVPEKHHGGAVVLLHSCAGIHRRSESTLRSWTNVLLEKGYAVLVIDHFAGRTADNNCAGKRNVTNEQMFYDIHDAIEHLAKIPRVDTKRIFALGFSLGGQMAGMSASPKAYQEWGKNKLRPRAVASLYGGCLYRSGQYLYSDSDLPVLWLMGKDDTEAPVDVCVPTLQDITKKIPASDWHIYPNTSHCWDCNELHGFSKTLSNGNSVTYLYNDEVTKDSQKRVIDFFNKFR